MGRGLLSRIAGGAQVRSERSEDLASSIGEHLRVLLNTRQGNAATAPMFGLVDITDLVHSFPKSIPALQTAIRSTILDYERRLRNVTVRHLSEGDPLVLNFEITAQTNDRSDVGTLRFRTQITPNGKVHVR